MIAPAVYNEYSIVVTPEDLKAAGVAIVGNSKTEAGGLVGDIIHNLEEIVDTITELKLGWAGKTSEEAKAFFDTWGDAMKKLFGSKKHPLDGTLALVGAALQSAGNNYNAAESYVIQIFSDLSKGLSPVYTSAGDPQPGSPSTDYLPPPKYWTTEWWQGAVSEVF